jgi:transposase
MEDQAALMLHRARHLLVEQRTQLSNAIRAHMSEIGIVASKGEAGFAALQAMLDNPHDAHVPAAIRAILALLLAQWRSAGEQQGEIDRQILAWHNSNADSRLVDTIPQFGPIVSSALVATIGDATRFASGRRLSAWIGIVPREDSTGGRQHLGGITKTGDRYLRQLLVCAASGMIRQVRAHPEKQPWFAGLLERMPPKKAVVALANKMARIAWAVLVHRTPYRAPTLTPPAGAAA